MRRTRPRLGAWLVSTALITALLPAVPARAGIEDTIGLGPRATALGNSYAARPGDFSAAWYNPAGLAPLPDASEGSGFVDTVLGIAWSHPLMEVEGLDGADVEIDAETPETAGALVGIRFDLGSALHLDGLVFGAALFLPARFFLWDIRPDEELQWAFLTDRTQTFGVHAGLGYRIAPWLAVGTATRVSFDVETITHGDVTTVENVVDPETNESYVSVRTQLGEDVSVFGKLAPSAGLLLSPTETLDFAVTWRGRMRVDDWGYTRITGVPGIGDLGYQHFFAHYDQPGQVTVAGAWMPREGLRLSSDVTWVQWSRALTTNRAELGPERYGDTITPSLGVSFDPGGPFEWLGGYSFVRSPIDNAGGPTNLLDSDRHMASLGATWSPGGGSAEEVPFSLSLALQLTRFVERTEEKDWRRFETDAELEANPGFPGYRYAGWVPAGQIVLETAW